MAIRCCCMATDWEEVIHWAHRYAEEFGTDEYWSEEKEKPPAWKEEKICVFCGKFFEACRPTQNVCSRECQSGRDMEAWTSQATVWLTAYNNGLSMDKIAKAAGVGKATVHRVLTYHGVKPRDKRASLMYVKPGSYD